MLWWNLAVLPILALASPTPRQRRQSSPALLTDLDTIQQYWGQITPYADNADNYFSVEDTGLPDGCQVEQAHLLERHGSRFPTSYFDDAINDENFAAKVFNWTEQNTNSSFTGPLSFLNTYQYVLGEGKLVGRGAVQSLEAGVTFWQRYGRILFNATVGQLAYNASFANGTARPKPVLRTTGQGRIENSQINWALGFFGSSYLTEPDPTFENVTQDFNVVVIPEGGTENNTLASYDSCINAYNLGLGQDQNLLPVGYLGDLDLLAYLPIYLSDAQKRLSEYVPKGFNLTVNDTYALQSICAYETNFLGSSEFCPLFTENEWAGFEATLEQEYYYDYAWGNPTGRAQGIGYLQELIARLTNQFITSSNSSVNSTLTNNTRDFPLGQKFYADFSHDDIIISVLTAASIDYFRDPPSLTEYPPNPDRHFILSHITPFAARLVTEVVGCGTADPKPQSTARTYYSPGQYGYSPQNATHKFIRMRLNNGIVPLSSVRGGYCGNRTDGLCPFDSFIASQANAYNLSNYDFACFGNYTIDYPNNGTDYDGTFFNGTSATNR